MAVIASALGVVCGLLLANSLMETFGNIVSEIYVRNDATQVNMNSFYPVAGFVCGILASLLAALFPARTSSRIAPASAIRSVPYADESFFTTRRLNTIGVFCLLVSLAIFAFYDLAGDSPLTRHKAVLIAAQLAFAIGISFFTPAFLKGFVIIFNRFFSGSVRRSRKAGRAQPPQEPGAKRRRGLSGFFRHHGVCRQLGIHVQWSRNPYPAGWTRSSNTTSSSLRAIPSASANSRAISVPYTMIHELQQVPGVALVVPLAQNVYQLLGPESAALLRRSGHVRAKRPIPGETGASWNVPSSAAGR